MKIIVLLMALLAVVPVFSQDKGINPLPALPAEARSAKEGATAGAGLRPVTYAVVIGISDYQDKDIPDLRFADKDAEAFANFLRSPAGGSLDGDHLKVLTNGDATLGQFAAALDWLWEVSKEGDLVILYFSGHGDVEKKSITQPGYLLCWDAPARVYMGGGAFALPMFQDVITTLSAQNKAKVVVITDACRSGKLAGSTVGGAQITGSNLARQYANEIKILSCQPDEYSIEGEQWGGGRGAFSFNLVNALYGLADGNNDLSVTLQEVGRYLEDHVTAEVAPVSQVPMVLGNRMERLATVDAQLLTALRSGKSNQMQMLSAIESRGMEDDVLATLDTSTWELYGLFKKSLKDKVFLEPAAACADAYYELLIQEPKLARLHSTMKRNYAAALQDDAQQTLNEWLKTSKEATLGIEPTERLPIKVFTEKVMTYPRCLDRAAELLGEKHYMYAALKARKYFFEGYLLANSNRNPDTELGGRALGLFRQSLAWQAEQPQVFWQISLVHGYSFRQPDSLEYYAWRAMGIHPTWIQPCTWAAYTLSEPWFNLYDRARPFLERATQIDSNSADVLTQWGLYYFGKKNPDKAEQLLVKATEMDSTNVDAWGNLNFFYTAIGRFDEAELTIKKAIALDSTVAVCWNNLGMDYFYNYRYDEAEQALEKTIQLDSTIASVWANLGDLYQKTGYYEEAEPILKKAIALDSTYVAAWGNLGVVYLQTGRWAESEQALKKAVALDSTNASALNSLGGLYLQTRRYEEAEPVLKKAVAIDSTISLAWSNLGNWYRITGSDSEAEQAFKKAVALDSTEIVPWNSLGFLYNNTQRYAEAEQALKKAIALDSTNRNAWSSLGFTYIQTRRYAEAEQAFKKAIALDSTFANPRKHLGMVCFKTNRPDEARQNFLKAIELNPNYAAAMLGMAYLLTADLSAGDVSKAEGKTEEAIGYVEQAIGKGSTFEQLESDEDLAPLRSRDLGTEWKELMKKHFPDKVKD